MVVGSAPTQKNASTSPARRAATEPARSSAGGAARRRAREAHRGEHPLRHVGHARVLRAERHPGAAQVRHRADRRARRDDDLQGVVVDRGQRAQRRAARGPVRGDVELADGDLGGTGGQQRSRSPVTRWWAARRAASSGPAAPATPGRAPAPAGSTRPPCRRSRCAAAPAANRDAARRAAPSISPAAPRRTQHLPPGELHRCIVAGAGAGVEGVYPRTVGRSYTLRTYGCQMNVHDSERMAGLLEAAGYARSDDPATADVVVLNTCAVRENADNKLYGNLGHLRPRKLANPGMQIAVGGCLAQKDRETIVRRAPWVDVVFGTHNVRRAAGAAGAGPAQRRGAGGDPRGARGVPVHAARRGASRPTRAGCRSPWAATTPARSASCPRCAAPSATGGRATCSPRSRRWRPRACWR